MKRGEIWTMAGGPDYAGKPRPALIVQDDAFESSASVTVCAFTTVPTDVPFIRVLVEPDAHNGLKSPCRLMVDKITTVPRSKLGTRIGVLDETDIARFDRAALVFLGFASPAGSADAR